MAKVTNEHYETTLSEPIVKGLILGLRLTMGSDKVTNHDEEYVLNWGEQLQADIVAQIQAGVPPTQETQERVTILADVLNGLKVPTITDDGAIVFVSSAGYIQKALDDVMEHCLDCTDPDCELSLPNRTKKNFPPN